MRNREKTRPRAAAVARSRGFFCAKQPLTERGGGGMLRTVPAGASCCGGLERMEQNGKTDHCNYRGRGTPRTALQYLCAGKSTGAQDRRRGPTPDPIRRRKTAEMHGFGEDMCFESAEALAERPRLADAVINGTMDTQHVKTAVPLLRRATTCFWKSPSPSMRTRCGSCSASRRDRPQSDDLATYCATRRSMWP